MTGRIKTEMNKRWLRFIYTLGLCVLLLLLFIIGEIIKYVLYTVFDMPHNSIFANAAEIVSYTVTFVVVIGVGLKDQKKTLASACFFRKADWKAWGAAVLCSIGFVLFYFFMLYFLALSAQRQLAPVNAPALYQ